MIDVKIVRYDEANQNIEGIKGQYGQLGDKNATFTVIKNLLIINLQSGAKYTNEKLPTVYDRLHSTIKWTKNKDYKLDT